MVTISPITQNYIAEIKPILLKRAEAAKDDFLQATKNENFNIYNYAKKGVYNLTSAKLEGTTLGKKGASLKILVHKYKNKSIFAIFKDGKVLGARGYLADKPSITSILDKLFQKGRIKQEELQYAKKRLNWA